MKASVFLSTAVLGLMALPSVAAAQEQMWLKDRRYSEGIGYRVGDFELHPGAAAEFGYDSNYLRRAEEESPISSLRLRITPSFSISTLSRQRREDSAGGVGPPPTVEFHGSTSLTYNEFFPLTSGANADLMRHQRNVGAALDLRLLLFPQRQWSGSINIGYTRQLTPTDLGGSGANTISYNRDLPTGTAELIWTPGAGLFEWRLGYQFQGTIFEDQNFSRLTNVNNAVITRGRWRFLPRTALMYDASFGFITYTNPGDTSAGGKLSSHPMRARLGLNGLITPSFGLTALVGWGASFYSNTSSAPVTNFDSVIGQAELKWFITPNPSADPTAATPTLSSVSVGFLRDFVDSYIGNYYERDRGYLNFTFFYGGRFLVVLDGGAGPIVYPQMKIGTSTVNQPGFTDIRVDAGLLGEFRFKDQFGINAQIRYTQNISKTTIKTPGAPDDSLAYRDIEAYLGFRWMM